MKPPFSIVGTTATHSAEPNTSSGIPLSGADSISSSTVAAALTRSSALPGLSSAAKLVAAKSARISRDKDLFIFPQLSFAKKQIAGRIFCSEAESMFDSEFLIVIDLNEEKPRLD